MNLSKMPSAPALPASCFQLKGHQASALGLPAIRLAPLPLPQHLWPKASQSTLPWWVNLEKQPGDWARGGVRKMRQGPRPGQWWPGGETWSALPRTLGSSANRSRRGQARGQLGFNADRKGLAPDQERQALIKCPAGVGSTLSGSCFSRPGRATTPPQKPSLCHLCPPKPPPSPVAGRPAASSSLAFPQNSTVAHTSEVQTILPWLPTGLRETPVPARPLRFLQSLAGPLRPSFSVQQPHGPVFVGAVLHPGPARPGPHPGRDFTSPPLPLAALSPDRCPRAGTRCSQLRPVSAHGTPAK